MANYSVAPPAEVDAPPRPGLLLEQVHLLYTGRFGTWFAIMAPTSVLSATVFLLADERVTAIFRSIPRGTIQYHLSEMAEAGAFRYGSFFLMWLLGCFALAAIATVTNGLDDGDSENLWKHDSYQRAREHLGAIAATALITFGAFLAGVLLVGFLTLALARMVGSQRIAQVGYLAGVLTYIVVASLIAWLGPAIPLLVKNNSGVWRALKTSIELSSGYEGALFLLVVETVVGSYLVGYATSHSLRALLPYALRHTFWYGWALYLVGALASAAVEAPLFIGFSVLAEGRKIGPSFEGHGSYVDENN